MIDGPARITREGHFVAKARVARANNVQDYRVGKGPGELDIADREPGSTVRIFRPASEIFAKDSLATALHRPVVIDHPGQDVTADNWKSLAVGDTGGDVLRDGDTMSVPIMVMDSAGVKAVQTTHPEFSWGYSGDLDLTPGKFGDAEYDGSLRNVRYNHLAMCGRARGGSDLRVTDSLVIVDERPSQHQEQPMKIKIGDAEVDATNGEAVSVAVQALNKKLGDAETTVGTLTAENTTLKDANEKLTGENTALKQQVEDAKVTPEKLQQLADARAKVIADAKVVGGDKLVTDGKTDAEIRKDAVVARMGDAAKDLSDAAIEGAFAAYAVSDGATERHTAPSGAPVSIGDAAADYAKARDARRQALSDAWKTPSTAAAA